MKKYLYLGMGGGLLLTIGLLFTVIMSIDSIIEKAVNEYGPIVTQTKVSLDSASIGVLDGSGSLKGLMVGNPVNRGFKDRDLFAMDKVEIAIDTNSLATDTIVLKEVSILSPKITYELKDLSESNFDALLQNVKERVEAVAPQKQAPVESEGDEKDAAKEKKIIIEHLYITGAEVTADMTGLPGEGLTLPLPDIHLKDIGKEDGGATPAETVQILLTAIYEAMQKAFAESGDFIMKGGQWIMQGADAVVEDVAKEAATVLEDTGTAIEEGVGKLF